MTSQQFPSDASGYQPHHRWCIVRLGPIAAGFGLYTDSNHCSYGVTGVSVDEDDLLVIHTDFDSSRELCGIAWANPDKTLALRGVRAGASGGASITKFDISSNKALSNAKGTITKPANTTIDPRSSVFNPEGDNLWIGFISLRSVDHG